MDRLEAMRLFVRTVESGSFSAVAREAGIGQPAVSKQIAALEASLGAQLLRRTSRRMSLTDAGQTFYETARRLVEDYDEVRNTLTQGETMPAGLVRVTVPPAFGRLLVVPRLPELLARYPGLEVELTSTERLVDLVEEGIDVAVRIGDLADSSLISRRLAATPIVTVATPRYLALPGTPDTVAALSDHACVVFRARKEPRAWTFRRNGQVLVHHPLGPFHTGDADQIRAAVLADMGLAHAPHYLFADLLASGQVQPLLQDHEHESLPIHALHPAGRRLPTRTRAFIEFLADILA